MSNETCPPFRIEMPVYGRIRISDGSTVKEVEADIENGGELRIAQTAMYLLGSHHKAEISTRVMQYAEILRTGSRTAGPTDQQILARLNAANDEGPRPILTCLADVQPRPITWLWRDRIPLGRLTLLVGRPGEGKSFMTADLAARVSTGAPFPDGAPCPCGSVLFISAEDDPRDTIRPRLDAHGANVAQIHMLTGTRVSAENGADREIFFTLNDLGVLQKALLAIDDVKLIVVDPIGSFLGGKADSDKDNAVRAILAPLAQLAEKYGAAVLVVAHRRKSGGDHADDLAMGSRAFTGIARAVWHLTRDCDNKFRRLLLPGKNNLAREGDGLAFSIAGDGQAARIEWETNPISMSADEALAAERAAVIEPRGPAPERRNAAADWLRAMLGRGPVAAASIRDEGKAAGFSWSTLQRAASELQVRREKERFGGGWTWELESGA